MAICEHTPPPRPPAAASIDGTRGRRPAPRPRRPLLARSEGGRPSARRVWLSPDEPRRSGRPAAAVAAWRGAQ